MYFLRAQRAARRAKRGGTSVETQQENKISTELPSGVSYTPAAERSEAYYIHYISVYTHVRTQGKIWEKNLRTIKPQNAPPTTTTPHTQTKNRQKPAKKKIPLAVFKRNGIGKDRNARNQNLCIFFPVAVLLPKNREKVANLPPQSRYKQRIRKVCPFEKRSLCFCL